MKNTFFLVSSGSFRYTSVIVLGRRESKGCIVSDSVYVMIQNYLWKKKPKQHVN